MTGTVKEYDKVKGFGFISGDDGEDYFVHVYGLEIGRASCRERV